MKVGPFYLFRYILSGFVNFPVAVLHTVKLEAIAVSLSVTVVELIERITVLGINAFVGIYVEVIA